MKAELITIGDEILIGQIVNTNAVFFIIKHRIYTKNNLLHLSKA